MKGCNELRLNRSTINEALQMWADATFKTRLTVVKVKELSSEQCFVVDVKEDETEPPRDHPTGAGL